MRNLCNFSALFLLYLTVAYSPSDSLPTDFSKAHEDVVSDDGPPLSTNPSNFEEACSRSSCCGDLSKLFSGFKHNFPISLSSTSEDSSVVWVFSYGSNMNPVKFSNWNIYPIVTVPAVLNGYALRFDTVLKAEGEPAFANIVQCPSSDGCVHGTISLIKRKELDLLNASEPMYVLRHISVSAYTGDTVNAEVYICPSEDVESRPSERYAKLVYCGALSAGLCHSYTDGLSDILFKDQDDLLIAEEFCHQRNLETLPLGHFASTDEETLSDETPNTVDCTNQQTPCVIDDSNSERL